MNGPIGPFLAIGSVLTGLRMIERAQTEPEKALAGLLIYVGGFRLVDMLMPLNKNGGNTE